MAFFEYYVFKKQIKISTGLTITSRHNGFNAYYIYFGEMLNG
jgi:hypothetical protein